MRVDMFRKFWLTHQKMSLVSANIPDAILIFGVRTKVIYIKNIPKFCDIESIFT